jgi:predicted nucleotidyltransferase
MKREFQTEVIERLKGFFRSREEVQFAILFGSLAKGTMSKLSDIDVAVMLSPEFEDTSPYGYQATLTADLMRELKRNDVDAVILNKAPIALRYQILRYGNFIHIRDMRARIQFQVDTLNRYEDLKRIRQVHDDACHRRWRNLIKPKTG